LNVKFQQMKKKTKLVGSFTYNDPNTPLAFRALKITSLSFNNNQAHFTGTAKIGKQKISFSVDVTDNGSPGTNNDFFSIQVSNGYSASGYLSSGNISIH